MDAVFGVLPNWIVSGAVFITGLSGGALAAWHVRGLRERIRTLENANHDLEGELVNRAVTAGRNSRLLVIGLKDALDYLTQNNPAAAREVIDHVAPHFLNKGEVN